MTARAPSKIAALSLKEVSFAWSQAHPLVLERVGASIEAQEMVGVIGPNGAGKSTLLRLIAGLLQPREGEIELFGRSLSSWTRQEIARRMALVPQDTTVPFAFTVEELVMMGRAPHMGALGLERRADVEATWAAIRALELEELSNRPIDRISGGERQRAFLARAFAQDPRVLLCDEPAAHLDLRHQAKLFAALRKRVQSQGLAVLLVLHDLNLAAATCDRLLLLDGGRIAAAGSPDEVIRKEPLESAYRTPLVVGTSGSTGRRYVLPA